MNEEADFWRAIEAAPHDDAIRLIYADWLEEHDEELKGRYLRTEVRLGQMDPNDDRIEIPWSILNELRMNLDSAWLDRCGKSYDVILKRVDIDITDQRNLVLMANNIYEAAGIGPNQAVNMLDDLPCVVLSNVSFTQAEKVARTLRDNPVDETVLRRLAEDPQEGSDPFGWTLDFFLTIGKQIATTEIKLSGAGTTNELASLEGDQSCL